MCGPFLAFVHLHGQYPNYSFPLGAEHSKTGFKLDTSQVDILLFLGVSEH